ncbi:MAG: bifunctional folylpolyglutamate synthase/dihydrofolate synthase [Bacteroidales bacterium]|nr:bifunctional folylpolyglutamate synthase/dihydrofolate synthase [Bacteroidales bacterium]
MEFSEKEYEALVNWLYSQFPSYQVVGDRAFKMELGAMSEFNSHLGFPDRKYPKIHVAGTNGKGSTSSMLASALAACGLKTGLYTSPHLTDFRERMKIVEPGGEYRMISKEEVFSFFHDNKDAIERIRPSFFEITTSMAFDFFAREKVDAAVVEVGLGGRLDATNIITPVLSVITNISLEHCQYLGYTLAEVAGEKAGIIKAGVPVVIGEALPETRPVFEAKAAEKGSPIFFAEDDATPFLPLKLEEMDLQGDYQNRNIRTLSEAVRVLLNTPWGREHLASLPDCWERILDGVRHAALRTGLRARWETLRPASEPAETGEKGKARIIADTGHNAHAFRWIREQIDKVGCDYEEIFFIFGVVADKDIHAISEFLPRDVHYLLTSPSSHRALPTAELANILSDYGINGKLFSTPAEALAEADRQAGYKDLIFIAGSNYLISDILALEL